jgi:hypothetical protein
MFGMKLSPLKLGITGVSAYFVSIAWVFLFFRISSRNDPAGWIVDRATPEGLQVLAMVGLGLVLMSVLWAVWRLIHRRGAK